jgi:hypothetical protein
MSMKYFWVFWASVRVPSFEKLKLTVESPTLPNFLVTEPSSLLTTYCCVSVVPAGRLSYTVHLETSFPLGFTSIVQAMWSVLAS